MDEKDIDKLVKRVVEEFKKENISIGGSSTSSNGIYDNIDDAIRASRKAQEEFIELSLEERDKILTAMKQAALKNADMLGQMAIDETGMGKMSDKADKIRLVAMKTPGIEDVKPRIYTGDHGLVLEERAPYRVIGAITPSTNPASTVLSNGLCALTGGNTMVFNPHPAAKNVTLKTVEILNKAAVEVGGPQNLLTSIKEPTQETSEKLMNHKNINLLVATGGEFMVGLAMHSGKKAIVGGPGNPPCIVDETADIEKAAEAIVTSSSFDNNTVCVLEKEVFVVDSVADKLISSMRNHKVYEIAESDIDRVTKLIIAKDEGTGYRVPIINKKYVGKAPFIILKDAGIDIPEDTILAIMQVKWDHPLVQVEQLLPILPIVRVADWKEAVERAIETEHHYRHTFTMHSTNIDRLSYMAKKCDASIFVKNGMSLQGLGYMGEGPTSMTIATPTGEGVTTPITFTRIRRCALVDRFRIV